MQAHGSYPHYHVSFARVVWITCALPPAALVVCMSWCVLVDFEESTRTQCHLRNNVYNFLPSISSAIGHFTPQRYVWNICIGLHSAPRMLMALGYHSVLRGLFPNSGATQKYARLARMAFWIQVIEISSLVGLSYISSTEDYEKHKVLFGAWVASSQLYMVAMCLLYGPGVDALQFGSDDQEKRSLWWKKFCFSVNITSFAIAAYCFYRHNTFCEDGVYSLFAICEVIIILTNVGFHATARLDFIKTNLLLLDGR